MSNHKNLLLIIILALVGIAAISLVFLFGERTKTQQQQTLESQQNLEALNRALEATQSQTQVDVPSANPLDNALPGINPVEAANPFRNVYQNPFE